MDTIDRKTAKKLNLKKYFTGKPCKHGHISYRWVLNGVCVQCSSENALRWQKKNLDRRRKTLQRYHERHPGRQNEHAATYRTRHPDRVAAAQKKHNLTPRRKLSQALRIRMYHAIKKQAKKGSAIKDLGCTVQELMTYLEHHFTPKMTWHNWGTMWEIDHIIPLHAFDLLDRTQFLKAAHFTNLQPLLNEQHRAKTSEEQKILFSGKP